MKIPCYCAALRVAARKTTALYDEELAAVGINLAQYSLLRQIERAGTVSLTELGRLAELDRSTVGRNVKALQGLGFVGLGSPRISARRRWRDTGRNRRAAAGRLRFGRRLSAVSKPRWAPRARATAR